MKNWFSRVFGGKKDEQPSANESPLRAGTFQAEATQPAESAQGSAKQPDVAQTVLAPQPQDVSPRQAAEDAVAAEWKVGDVILDTYEVKEVHEGGGMGLVYRVHHRAWNTELAVKSPRPEFFQSQAQKDNFARECETWINLGLHPHIVSCHYVRTLGSIPRVFAEYVEGGSLKDWIDSRRLYEGGPQEALKRILDIAIQTAWGLHYAHAQGVIHQDVKPGNVLMLPDDTAKITDFGLAKAQAVVGGSAGLDKKRSILVSCGGMTPAYCSPEQANKKALSRKTDIWSWAVSVLEMFAREVCWQSGMAAPAVLKHLEEVRAEGVAWPEMSADLKNLLDTCFAVDPAARPANFPKVVEKLKLLYLGATGQGYEREVPEATTWQADALNNRGVSLLDLGKPKEAEKCFDEALAEQAGHPQATFNRGLVRWRSARATDEEILTALKQTQQTRPRDWIVPYLISQIHLERRDAEGAVQALSEAEQLDEEGEAKQVLTQAREMQPHPARLVRAFEGHTGHVESVAWSPDGCWALSGSDNKLSLWEVSKGRCVRTFEGHTGVVKSVAWSPDGRWALSGGAGDQTLRLWEVSSGRCLRTFAGHTSDVNSVAWSPDGRWVLSASGDFGGCRQVKIHDNTLRLWEVSSGRCVRTLEGHTGTVYSVAWSPDGRWALSGSDDNTLRLWEVSSGHCVRTFEGHDGEVNSVAWSPDGRWALSGSSDKSLRALESKERRTSATDALRLWEVSSGRCVRTLEGHAGDVNSVAWSPDGRWALSGGGFKDYTIRLWELPLNTRSVLAAPAVARLMESRATKGNQKRFDQTLKAAEQAIAGEDWPNGWLLLQTAREQPGHKFSARAMELAHRFAVRGIRSAVNGGWVVRTFEGHTGEVTSVAWSPDGCQVLSGSSDGTLRLWEVSSGHCLRTFKGHQHYRAVNSVAWSPDGRWVLSGSQDHTLRLWEVSSGSCVRTFQEHTGGVESVAWSPDGRWVLSGGGFEDHTLRLWEVSSRRCVRTFKGHTSSVASVAWSPDGRRALSGSLDTTLRLWEVRSGRCLEIFENLGSGVTSVAWNPDGRGALLGTSEKILRLFEVSSGRCVKTFEGNISGVKLVAWNPDGRWALLGTVDKTPRQQNLWVSFGSGSRPRL